MNPTILMMLSGGLDSTATLQYLINNPVCDDQEIHVHHMNLVNFENRAPAESIAVHNILNYLKPLAFQYSESVHQYPNYGNRFLWDSDLVSFVAGNICLANPTIKYVAIGVTASDGSAPDRVKRAGIIFNSFETQAIKVFPIKGWTKQQAYDSLPVKLRDLTWSCRHPKYNGSQPIQCGTCKSCSELKQIKMRSMT